MVAGVGPVTQHHRTPGDEARGRPRGSVSDHECRHYDERLLTVKGHGTICVPT